MLAAEFGIIAVIYDGRSIQTPQRGSAESRCQYDVDAIS